MTAEEKISIMRETIERSALLLNQCETFIHMQFSGTPGRATLIKEIERYKLFLNDVFRPEVIN